MDLLTGLLTGQLTEVLDRLDDPLFVIDHQRLVLFQNAVAARILDDSNTLAIRAGRLQLTSFADDMRLEEIIGECNYDAERKYQPTRGMKLFRQTGSGEWLIGISALEPVPEISDEPIFLVHFVDRLHARSLPSAALLDIFDLTLKEAEIIDGLARNQSLQQIGAAMSLSHETIRAYMKRIFRKCEVRSRVELLVLIERLSLLAK